jgi:hypothetical protein
VRYDFKGWEMSNFTWIDGGIVGVYILAVVMIGVLVRRYVSKVVSHR